MTVDPAFARWLREGVIFAEAPDAAIAALWGELARISEITSCLATAAGAAAEGVRQIAFLGAALALDEHLVDGLRHDLFGQPVTIVGDRLGYEAGADVFVIGIAEADDLEQTTLTALRKLP